MAEWFYRLRDVTIFFAALMLFKYWLFLMIAPWHSVKEERRQLRVLKRDPVRYKYYTPIVSVVVPAWNEEVGILRTIQSLLDSTYKRLEIVVVNDGSTDGSHDVIRNFLEKGPSAKHYPKMIHYHYKPNGGKGSALNYGIEQAKGHLIVTMDADTVFAPDAITNLAEYFRDSKVDAAVGQVRVGRNHTLIGHIQQLEYTFGFYFKRAHSVMNAEYIYGGACAAFRKINTFERFGLFDTSNKTEDIEMSLRTKYHGLNAVYAENVVCVTEGASTVQGLVNQRLRWKKGRIDTFGKYRQMFFSWKRHHNNWLAFMVLPYSVLGEIQLLFEPLGIALLVSYSVISGDYLSLGLGLLFILMSYIVVSLFNQRRLDLRLLFSFPFTWPLFYVTTWIEYIVLLKSMKLTLRGADVEWQRWERKGVDLELAEA